MTSSTENIKTLDAWMPLIREQLAAGKTVTISPNGISMLPMLRQGKDSVELSPLPEKLKKYDIPLYRRSNGQYVLHRIVKTGEQYTCIGDHQYRYEYSVRREQMIALVTAFSRDGKRVETTNFAYRAYCVLWCGTRGLRHAALDAVSFGKGLLHGVKRRLFRK